MLKNAHMQGARSAFHLPVRQAILRSEAYFGVRRNEEGRGERRRWVFFSILTNW